MKTRLAETLINRRLQESGEALGLDGAVADSASDGLNTLLPMLISLYLCYYGCHWNIKGPRFRDLHLFFSDHLGVVQGDFDAVAERIVALGGVASPTCRAVCDYFVGTPDEQLARLLDSERGLCGVLRGAVTCANDCNDHGTAQLLGDMLVRAEKRAAWLDSYLG